MLYEVITVEEGQLSRLSGEVILLTETYNEFINHIINLIYLFCLKKQHNTVDARCTVIVEASPGLRYLKKVIISVAGMTFNCKLLTIEENCYKGNKVSLSSSYNFV